MILTLWAKFIICSLIILIFGLKLSKAADHIVKMGRFSEGFMGVFFLAAITSFPEIFTSIASVTKVYAPDLAVGDLIGSVILNLMIIAILDFKQGKSSILSLVNKDHLVTCGFSLLTLGILIASLSLGLFTQKRIGIFNIGIESPLIILIYILGISYVYKYAQKEIEPNNNVTQEPVKTYLTFILCGLVIIGSGFWLASLGKAIVDIKGWNEMYFGTIIIAFATSLPEIVVCTTAVSMGSANMAIANILGSNLFNMAIIPVVDIIFQKGYLLDHVSFSHIYSCLFAIILTLIVFGSILYKSKKTFMRLGVGVAVLIFTFIIGNFILFNTVNK